jgi:N-methylhydantoinase B/oxoprolinase/acetone carboxylase alpha subunit
MPLAAQNRFYEGMKLPPIKIGEDFTVRDDMTELISNYMSRASREAINDFKARVARGLAAGPESESVCRGKGEFICKRIVQEHG